MPRVPKMNSPSGQSFAASTTSSSISWRRLVRFACRTIARRRRQLTHILYRENHRSVTIQLRQSPHRCPHRRYPRAAILPALLVRYSAYVLAALRLVPLLGGMDLVFPSCPHRKCQHCLVAACLHRSHCSSQRLDCWYCWTTSQRKAGQGGTCGR